MLFNKIDELINKVLDDYFSVISNDKEFTKIKKESNFIKSQKNINFIILNYLSTVNNKDIDDIVKTVEGKEAITDIITKYIVIYTFLNMSIDYTSKNGIFINNVVEFSKNQGDYDLKIPNFFNSDSNALTIKLFYIIRNIREIIKSGKIQRELIKFNPYSKETYEFLDNFDNDFITNAFVKSKDNKHNLAKTIIIMMLYKDHDKKVLYNFIEQSQISEGEYMFIDIVEPITDTINFNTIENLLDNEQLLDGYAYDIWNYMGNIEEENKRIVSNEDKINILINSGLIIPIVDDFLLYHRDEERYDKNMSEKDFQKKKEDTKIRYIIGKIDSTADLYSESTKKDPILKKKIMNNFTGLLNSRKAVTRNEFEEIKIINKFQNAGKRSIENDDFYNELMNYRKYSYVNFNHFEKYGFSNMFNKTVPAVRAVNFDSKDFAQTSKNSRLQVRVGMKNTIGNIVGFVIPSNKKSFFCINQNDMVDVRSLRKNKNGFYVFLNFLRKSVIQGKQHESSIYWLFDIDTDKVKNSSFELKSNNNFQDIIKNMMGEFYDKFVKEVYIESLNKIDLYVGIGLDNVSKIISYMENNIVKYPLPQNIKDELEYYVFNKIIPKIDVLKSKYEKNEILYGIENNPIILPEIDHIDAKNTPIAEINLLDVNELGETIETEKVTGVCQHNITWDDIMSLKRYNHEEYMKRLYNFMTQYVDENSSGDFVCKSCGHYLDIKKYTQDGTFNSDKKFISFTMPLNVNLEDIPKYNRYSIGIKIMEKNLEKIASSVGISYYVGNTIIISWRRKEIIKNTLDMVSLNNTLLKKIFVKRNETKSQKYGISRNISNLFVFEMEPDIFKYSSRDKDREQFKMIKRNNITTYMMTYLLLELNESQILFFIPDSKYFADIKYFDKIYRSLFSGMKILRNDKGDTVDIINYKILCYLIYILSAKVAKHRLWYASQSTEKNIQKMIPILQRFIIHTTIDLINSILENSYKTSEYIFEIFRVKFLTKLDTLYSNEKLYRLIVDQSKFNNLKSRTISDIQIKDKIPLFKFNEPQWKIDLQVRFTPKLLTNINRSIDRISNITNCESGESHKFKIINGKFTCQNCNKQLSKIKYDKTLTEKIINKFDYDRLNVLAQKYCLKDSNFHEFKFNPKQLKNICQKCNNIQGHRYSNQQLDNINKIVTIKRKKRIQNTIDTQNKFNNVDNQRKSYITKVIEKNNNNYDSKFIDNFINIIKENVGDVLKGENPINIDSNQYVIDHDKKGDTLKSEPIIITDKDDKIRFKENHPHFKTDVIYYIDTSKRRTEVYYDVITKTLIGYKDESRSIVDVISDKKIGINYSIKNKLKLIGFSSEYLDINTLYSDIDNIIKNDTNRYNKYIYDDISRNRVDNLKNVIKEFQKCINRIYYNYEFKDEIYESKNYKDNIVKSRYGRFTKFNKYDKTLSDNTDDPLTFNQSKINKLVEEFRKKLEKMSIYKDGHRVLKHWKGIVSGYFKSDYSNTTIKINNILDVKNFKDPESNKILFYLLSEMTKLIQFNSGYDKNKLIEFIINFINTIFDKYNEELEITDPEIRKFIYTLKSDNRIKLSLSTTNYAQNNYNDDNDNDNEEEMTIEEIEQQIDDVEMNDAIDMDNIDMDEHGESQFDRLTEYSMNANFDR
jgi:hypothetical protein